MSNRSIAYLFSLILAGSACSSADKKEDGEKLAKTYCVSCHILPLPSLLNKETWLSGVFPEMGPRLGIRSYFGLIYPVQIDSSIPERYYPSSPAMTQEAWSKIVSYYYNEAPDSLERNYLPVSIQLDRFEAKTPDYPTGSPPETSYVKIDPGNHALYVANGIDLKLRSFDQHLKPVGEVQTPNVMVDIAFHDLSKPGLRSATVLTMGALTPLDVTHGSMQSVTIDEKFKITISSKMLADSLPRPVSFEQADMNKDGRPDFVVCGFGNFAGSLFWLKNTGEGHFEKIVLRNQPGSTQAKVDDFNNDGRLDILALMAQGDEGIFLYEQLADGGFHEKNLLRFSPVAGSISIDLADFNQDGYPDIIYTSGDNADFSKILKPYHGVYIYLNDGHWNFKQAFFFAINGCFKALARDYDLDGDIDIATISYFPDFIRRPEESFVYLQNEGHYNFKAFSFPQHAIGRWLTLDAGDLDGDGDLDLVLGNLSIGPANTHSHANWEIGPAFVLLENKTR
jgi:hypothetical protein